MRSTAAAVLIGTCGRYLLQRRDDIPNILFPGMIGLFGGHIEGEESAHEAVRREVAEETGYEAPQQDYMSLMTCVVPLPDGSRLDETLFLLDGVPTNQLIITEGTLLPISEEQLDNHLSEMTPATAAAIQAIRHCLPS